VVSLGGIVIQKQGALFNQYFGKSILIINQLKHVQNTKNTKKSEIRKAFKNISFSISKSICCFSWGFMDLLRERMKRKPEIIYLFICYLEFELIFCLEFGLWLGYFIISLG
jgi:hypothetical protein